MNDYAYVARPRYAHTKHAPLTQCNLCSYSSINGVASCANSYLLNDVIRGQWDRRDAVITSDCDAVKFMMGEPMNLPDRESAAIAAIKGGLDIEMGNNLTTETFGRAVEDGRLDKEDIIKVWRRSFAPLFRSGRFDPKEFDEWRKLDKAVINSTAHQQISLEAALMGNVLLKNEKSILPLEAGKNIAVLGPFAAAGNVSDSYLSDYAADQTCFNEWSCIHNFFDEIAYLNERDGSGSTTTSAGVGISDYTSDPLNTNILDALEKARKSDVVILCLGIDRSIEFEGTDRFDTKLPGMQESFAKQILALKKPTVLVLVNGGALAIDNLIEGSTAIIEAFNPGVLGAKALSQLMFGKENKWGRLPVTMYPHDYVYQQNMLNYDMARWPGRTYKYYVGGQPLFKFGHGLSLTTFENDCVVSEVEKKVKITCNVTNAGR